MSKNIQTSGIAGLQPLKLGFVPLTDCAPLVMAEQLGLFAKYGLRVRLSRELGWATVRDKIVYGELDAAHALAAMPLAVTLGLGAVPCNSVTALVLNQHGNGITLSDELWKHGVRDGHSLREFIRKSRRDRTLTFGIVFSFSSHRHLLRAWLSAHGIDPEREVRFVVVPPPQMVANLKAGHLDGFCVGEPWNSLAVHARAGWIAATSAELDYHHPEKVLMAREEFLVRRKDDYLALVAALLESCEFCDQPENRARIAATLARPEYVGVPEEILKRGLSGQLDCGHGVTRRVDDFYIFHRDGANEPAGAQAAWALQLIRASGLCPEPSNLNSELGRRVFRADLFKQATQLILENTQTTNHETNTNLISA